MIDILMVRYQQAIARRRHFDAAKSAPFKWEKVHAIIVHTPLLQLLIGAVAAILFKARAVRNRVAPRDQHLGGVALRHHNFIHGWKHRNALEANANSAAGYGLRLRTAAKTTQDRHARSIDGARHRTAL